MRDAALFELMFVERQHFSRLRPLPSPFLMPGHHAFALDHGKAREEPVCRIGWAEADDVVYTAESLVTARKRLQFPAFPHPVAVKVSPDFPLAPPTFGAKVDIDIRRYRYQPERFRIESQLLLQYVWPVL